MSPVVALQHMPSGGSTTPRLTAEPAPRCPRLSSSTPQQAGETKVQLQGQIGPGGGTESAEEVRVVANTVELWPLAASLAGWKWASAEDDVDVDIRLWS